MFRKLLLPLLLFASGTVSSQTNERHKAYLISFDGKQRQGQAALSAQSMKNRESKQIALTDEDFAVDQSHIDAICRDSSIRLLYPLRWMNAIVVTSSVSDSLMEELGRSSFVKDVKYVGLSGRYLQYEQSKIQAFDHKVKIPEVKQNFSPSDYGYSYTQVHQIGADRLHKLGYKGKDVRIAVFDAGFMNVDRLGCFAAARGSSRLYQAFDLVDLDNQLADKDNHGTAVTSCFFAYDPGKFIGTAPEATTFLFRTEHAAAEDMLEELNWCRAAEMADSLGVDIVTSSLGYTQFDDAQFNHRHDQLNGRSSYISRAAATLVSKGILVVNSAGNEGDDPWFKIGCPADAPEVLTVGAVDDNGKIGVFSSRGNNVNGQIKPDICAMGVQTVVASTFGTYYKGNGTSYSTPILTGAVALLKQAHPEVDNEVIKDALRATARRNHAPDSIYGHGLANAYAAHLWLEMLKDSTADPHLSVDERYFLLFNDGYSDIDFKLYEQKRFLLVFKYLKKVEDRSIRSDASMTYVPLHELEFDCQKKYTIKIKMRSAVDNYKLRDNDLSFCSL